MKKYILLFIILSLITVQRVSVYSATYIREIEIVRLNVFDKELENGGNFIYRLANKFHVVTRDRIIRQELLFNKGDPFDSEHLEQSIRNIRTLPFIGDATSNIKYVADDSIDIEIIAEDLWTTTIGISGEGGGGQYNFTIYANEKNTAGLGLGIDVNLQFTTDDDNGYLIQISDRRLMGTRLMYDLILRDFSYSRGFGVLLYHPFYSPYARWNYGISFNVQDAKQRLFYQGQEYFRYDYDYKDFQVHLKRAYGMYNRFESGLLFKYCRNDYSDRRSESLDFQLIPENETFSGPGVNLATYLDEFGTIEDLTEHATIRATSIWSGPAFNGDYEATYLEVESGFFFRPTQNLYAGFKNTYSNFIAGSSRERITNTMQSILYYKPSTYHLLAGRFFSHFAWRQKPSYQIVLGGINGLRGYPDRYFEGAKLALMNAEYRIFTPVQILTVSLGGAAFFDAGYVWDDGESVDITDLKKDVGLGLRFGLTKSSTARIVCFNVARALDQDHWYISFRTGNLFGLARYQ